jgi:hypothetical protein
MWFPKGNLLKNGLAYTKYNVLPNNTILLVTIEKFETNPMLVNVKKLKAYKYMKFEVQKQKQQMSIYWEQSACGLQAKNFDTKVEDEDYVTQKPQMQRNEEKEQMKDLEINTILSLEL